ncbi:protein of unknown function [Burkholderia multivorans]
MRRSSRATPMLRRSTSSSTSAACGATSRRSDAGDAARHAALVGIETIEPGIFETACITTTHVLHWFL